jgi:hypothetical protein
MKDILALAAGIALASFAVKWWCKREVSIKGSISANISGVE